MTTNGPLGAEVSDLLTALESGLDALTATPPPVDHRERLEAIARLRIAQGRAQALVSVWVAIADRQHSADRAAGSNITDWMTNAGQADPKESAGLLKAGKDLLANQRLEAAVLGGKVTPAQARGITRSLDELPAELTAEEKSAATELLIGDAGSMTPLQLGKQAQAVLEQVAPDKTPSAEDEAARLEAQRRRAIKRRRLSYWAEDGSLIFNASLPVLEGDAFVKVLDAFISAERSAGQDDPGFKTKEQRYADALIQFTARFHPDNLFSGETRPMANRPPVGVPSVAGDRPRVVVTMRESELRERAEQAGILESGERIGAGDLRRLCCDADITPVVLGTGSEVLEVGRTHRLVTGPIRLALAIRDGGCSFPGCDVPNHRCEAHHIEPWWAGGETSLTNLMLLCPHHHGVVEPKRFWNGPPDDQWQARIGPVTGLPEFRPPVRMGKGRAWQPGNPNVPRAG